MDKLNGAGQASLAERALDRTRLLEGENPDSLEVEDAVRWTAVYAELIEFKYSLLAQMRKGLQRLPMEAAHEIRTVDMAIIRKQLERYEACRAFWERRLDNLALERQVVAAAAGRHQP